MQRLVFQRPLEYHSPLLAHLRSDSYGYEFLLLGAQRTYRDQRRLPNSRSRVFTSFPIEK
jgi:hypothetical protein